ncbi:MAG: hypothetical protein ACR2LO_09430, partial [Ilumatobacteraceae bacterium]
AGDPSIGGLDSEVERRVVERTLVEALRHAVPVSVSHRMRGVPTLSAIDDYEALRGRRHGWPIGGIHPGGAVLMASGESGSLG